MRYFILFCLILVGGLSNAQVYTVNAADDVDNGVCDGVHCSLREAIKAAEADGVPSVINFNIPGAGVMTINPTGPYPTVTQDDLTILGETQPGGAGTIQIDFNFRDFMGIGFWDVLGKNFYISGIDFSDYQYKSLTDHLFQFGDLGNNASNARIFNCSFITDIALNPKPAQKKLINIFRADNFSLSNCIFGTDRSKMSINNMEGYVSIDGNQGSGVVTIDSNIFVNNDKMIEFNGGRLKISKNIFGAVDTSKSVNLLNPDNAILGIFQDWPVDITDNFFFGFTNSAIGILSNSTLTINKNRFYNDTLEDINVAGRLGNEVIYISDNFARNGKQFLTSRAIAEINVERNNISNYNSVFYNQNNILNQKIRHIDNRMTCINSQVIVMDPALFPSHAIPTITTVNRNRITGTGRPNDSVVVYSNNRLPCPNAVCHAGVELGRTQADGAGNWVLNAAYPNRTSISAFQYDSNPFQNPSLYSEFSNCYQCPGLVKINFDTSACTGQSIIYRGKAYSDLNPYDSIPVKGDGVSICDSVIIVNIKVNTGYRSQINPQICYDSTQVFGPVGNQVAINRNHLIDSLRLKSAFGCDSIITISATEVGFATFNQTICDNASVNIFGTIFDKNNTSGTAIGKGRAVAGCDSVVSVQLQINNFTEYFLNQVMCPGTDTLVEGQLFNQARPSGDVNLPGRSSTGCDSLIHVSLTYPNNVGAYSAKICPEDSILVINTYFSQAKPNGQVVVKGGSSFGCDSVINVNISFFPLAQGTYNNSICTGDSVFIIDQFFSDRNTSAVIQIPNGSSNGCDTSVTVNIGILPNAQGSFTQEICRGDTVTLFGEQFFFGKPTGSITRNNLAANGCDSTITVKITFYPDAVGNFDTTVCINQTVTLYGQTFSILDSTGSLKIPNIATHGCDSFLNVTVHFIPDVQGMYTPTICRKDTVRVGAQIFTVSNPNGVVRLPGQSTAGCDSVVTVALNFNPSIFLDFTANDLKCNAANTGDLILDDIRGGSGNFKYSIDGGPLNNYVKGQVIGNLSQGNHTIRISDQLSCDTAYSFTINNSAILSLQLPNDTTIRKGSSIDINAVINFINPTSIIWDPPTFLSCTDCLNPRSTPDQTTTYMLTVTDENDCSVKDVIKITVFVEDADIFVPNVFSPNGDNVNDIFRPVFKDPLKTRITIFQIFDRWGNLLYEYDNGAIGQEIGWSGEVDKEKVIPGVYVYAIQFIGEDGVAKWKTGDVTVIR